MLVTSVNMLPKSAGAYMADGHGFYAETGREVGGSLAGRDGSPDFPNASLVQNCAPVPAPAKDSSAALGVHVGDIVGSSPSKDMRWVATDRVVALVQRAKIPERMRSALKHDPIWPRLAARPSEVPVSAFVNRARPRPALIAPGADYPRGNRAEGRAMNKAVSLVHGRGTGLAEKITGLSHG